MFGPRAVLEFTKGCREPALGKPEPIHTFAKPELFNNRMCCSQAGETTAPTLTAPIPASQALSSLWSYFALTAVLCQEK